MEISKEQDKIIELQTLLDSRDNLIIDLTKKVTLLQTANSNPENKRRFFRVKKNRLGVLDENNVCVYYKINEIIGLTETQYKNELERYGMRVDGTYLFNEQVEEVNVYIV